MRTGIAALCLLLTGCGGGAIDAINSIDGPGGEVRALTGARTRAVWVQGDGNDPRALGESLVLMGFDSHDGRGERTILAERGSYVKPLLTPDGERIVFSTRAIPGPPETFVVGFDGSGLRKLAGGAALDVWKDPRDGGAWVYLGTDNDGLDFAKVWRFPIDTPQRRELVWDKSVVGLDGFRVSADGRYASGLCPWPEAVLADLRTGTMKKLGDGCWTSLTTARGLLYWYFDGAHRNVTMVDVATGARWMVNLNNAEGFDGAEVYHPRWTNHPRFLTISGPYNQGGANQARAGGPQVEVYLGRLSEDFSKVEAWARVTNNSAGDTYPDLWIDTENSPHAMRPGGRLGPELGRGAALPPSPDASADRRSLGGGGSGSPGDRGASLSGSPGDRGALVVNVRLDESPAVPSPETILPYRNALVVNEYEVLDVVQGTYEARWLRVAQWAIRDSKRLPPAGQVGSAYTLVVEPYAAHPELEGERLISESEDSGLPLYYHVR
jgi:hypothetical protein